MNEELNKNATKTPQGLDYDVKIGLHTVYDTSKISYNVFYSDQFLDEGEYNQINGMIKNGGEKLKFYSRPNNPENGNTKCRKMSTFSIAYDNVWLFQRMLYPTLQANLSYKFDIKNLSDINYVVQPIGDDQRDYISDLGNFAESKNKITTIVEISNPEEYEGGEIQIITPEEGTITLTKERFTSTSFPSWFKYKINPVTKGEKRYLIARGQGEPFR